MSKCSALLKLFCKFSYCFGGKCSLERLITSLVKPMMAFIGVRSSCDMFAKNSDLCREACCNCSFSSLSCRVRSAILLSSWSACSFTCW